jgi:hypothetical protein
MSEESDRRLFERPCWDAQLIMGVLYMILFGAMIILQYVVDIPAGNEESIKILISNMTLIQAGIVGYFFGSSKNTESVQRALAQGNERTTNVVRELAVKAGNEVPPADPTKTVQAADMNVAVSGDLNVKDAPK